MTASVQHGRTDGKWVGQVYVGRNSVTGKHVRKKKTFDAEWDRAGRTEAQHQFDLWAAGLDRVELLGGGPAPSTLNELLDRWIATGRSRWKPRTLEDYERKADWWVRPYLGEQPISEVTGRDLDMLYAHLITEGGRLKKSKTGVMVPTPLSGTTVHGVHRMMSAVFNQAVKWRDLPRSPVPDATAPKKDSVEIVPPTNAEIMALKEVVSKTPVHESLFRLALTTGARRSQLLGVRWSDVDVERASLLFRSGVTATQGQVHVLDTKSGRPYVVALDPETLKSLRRLRAHNASIALQCGVPLVGDPFLFSHQPDGGTPWHPDAVKRWWSRTCRAAGVSGVRLHDLRHYTATRLLAAGVDVGTVAGRLGHKDATVTLRVYAHFMPEKDRDAADTIAAIVDAS
jgi:integrase